VTNVGVRRLNRALLERQLLLRRRRLPTRDALERLVGLQAQAPLAPYLALWSRPDELAALVETRRAVRTHLMRNTIHLVTDTDCLALRPVMQPVLDRTFASSPFARALDGVDRDALVAAAQQHLAAPISRSRLAAGLAERWPDRDPLSLAYAVTHLVPTIQPPPRGVWGKRGGASWVGVQAWLGRPLTAASVEPVVLRYLAAFGPASAADLTTWSGLGRSAELLERLRPRLRTLRDADGRELFDLPDAPLPEEDTPAPPRFLPEYDNVLLSHADRTRFGSDEQRSRLGVGARAVKGTLLVDGLVTGTWVVERDGDTGGATLVVHHTRLTRRARGAVTAEGRRMVRFREPGAPAHDVRLVPLD